MSVVDYIILAAVGLWAAYAIYSLLRRKKSGCGCGSDCRNCTDCEKNKH